MQRTKRKVSLPLNEETIRKMMLSKYLFGMLYFPVAILYLGFIFLIFAPAVLLLSVIYPKGFKTKGALRCP